MPFRLGNGGLVEGTGERKTRRSRCSPLSNDEQRDAEDEQNGARRQKAREDGAHGAGRLGEITASRPDDHASEEDAEYGDE